MKSIRPLPSLLPLLSIFFLLAIILFPPYISTGHAETSTIIVTAEGLADPENDAFKNDPTALDNALLNDAKKQAIEKIVALYMDNPLLAKNYTSIDNGVLADNKKLIKTILHTSEPWTGGDGFMHILIKAEVYGDKVENTLRGIGKKQRTNLIRQAGNPRITVAITVRDSARDSSTKPERSPIAENIFKEHISAFGYRVWSEQVQGNGSPSPNSQSSDFNIQGEVKFKPVNLKLKTSGIEINKLTITSWTVKCTDSTTGEEIYFNNKIPARRSWNTEDAAVEAIGKLMGEEFSQDFFERQLLQRTQVYQLTLQGLPTYDTAILFKKELIGLRPVLNAELRSFDNSAGALYEVEFSASDSEFSEVLNNSVLKPLNSKFGKKAFSLSSVKNLMIKVHFRGSGKAEDITAQFEEKPPSSLASASPVRLNQIAATRGALKKVEEINPQGAKKVIAHRRSGGKTSLEGI